MKQSVLLTGLIALVFASFFVRAQGRTSTRDGVYTDRQASRGEASYKKACASCHGETLGGSAPVMPPLAGSDFMMNWAGQTAADLFDKMQTSMPADHPGTLTRAENADILAYVLKYNKLPAGKTELPSDADGLKKIRLEAARD